MDQNEQKVAFFEVIETSGQIFVCAFSKIGMVYLIPAYLNWLFLRRNLWNKHVFFACCYKLRKVEHYSIVFGWKLLNWFSCLDHRTLRLIVSQKGIDDINWFFLVVTNSGNLKVTSIIFYWEWVWLLRSLNYKIRCILRRNSWNRLIFCLLLQMKDLHDNINNLPDIIKTYSILAKKQSWVSVSVSVISYCFKA